MVLEDVIVGSHFHLLDPKLEVLYGGGFLSLDDRTLSIRIWSEEIESDVESLL